MLLRENNPRSVVVLALLIWVFALTVTVSLAADRRKNGKIAFFANFSGTSQIYTINPDGTGLFQVTNLPQPSDPFALESDFRRTGSAFYSRMI